eukprot:1159045-Pelagomonas_calceolata.AAC.19
MLNPISCTMSDECIPFKEQSPRAKHTKLLAYGGVDAALFQVPSSAPFHTYLSHASARLPASLCASVSAACGPAARPGPMPVASAKPSAAGKPGATRADTTSA